MSKKEKFVYTIDLIFSLSSDDDLKYRIKRNVHVSRMMGKQLCLNILKETYVLILGCNKVRRVFIFVFILQRFVYYLKKCVYHLKTIFSLHKNISIVFLNNLIFLKFRASKIEFSGGKNKYFRHLLLSQTASVVSWPQ